MRLNHGRESHRILNMADSELSRTWGAFLESPVTFRALEADDFCHVCIQDQSFNNFGNETMKLSFNEAELIGL